MADSPDEVEEFANILTCDRLIQIYVGEQDAAGSEKPFLIQQSLLCITSDYFTKTIKNERLGSGQSGTLRFPVDDPDVWKIFLYWLVQGSLPGRLEAVANDDAVLSLIRCWIFGDKYFIAGFQDEVMLEMLRAGDLRPWKNFELVIEVFRDTLPDSHLRWMATEQLVSGVFSRHCFEESQFDALDEIPGAARIILRSIDFARQDHEIFELKFGEFELKLPRWKCFMVGEGPITHWVHEVASTL